MLKWVQTQSITPWRARLFPVENQWSTPNKTKHELCLEPALKKVTKDILEQLDKSEYD